MHGKCHSGHTGVSPALSGAAAKVARSAGARTLRRLSFCLCLLLVLTAFCLLSGRVRARPSFSAARCLQRATLPPVVTHNTQSQTRSCNWSNRRRYVTRALAQRPSAPTGVLLIGLDRK